MRFAVVPTVVGLLLLSVACKPHKVEKFHGAEYDCLGAVSNYPAVTKTKQADGHCDVKWDISKPHVNDDDPSLPPHPEIGLLVARNDEIKFTHGGGHKFHYDIKAQPPSGVDETTCYESPVKLDPQKANQLPEHNLGKVQLNPNGPAECHYKLKFYLDDGTNAVIDPHIKIGS